MWWLLAMLMIRLAGDGVQNRTVPPIQVVAIGQLESNEPLLAAQIRSTLTELFAGSSRLQVVDRSALKQVLQELQFQQMGLVPPELQVPFGEVKPFSLLLTGSLQVEGSRFVLSAHWVDVRTGTILPHSAEQVEGERSNWQWHLLRLADRLHRRLTGAGLVPGLPPDPLPEEGIRPTSLHKDYETSVYRWHIEFVMERNLMRAYPDGTFRPGEVVSERYFAAVVGRLRNLLGGHFVFQPHEPDQPVRRMQAVLVLDRLLKACTGEAGGYYLEVPDWAKGIVGWDASRSALLTREVLAALVTNLLKSSEKNRLERQTEQGERVTQP